MVKGTEAYPDRGMRLGKRPPPRLLLTTSRDEASEDPPSSPPVQKRLRNNSPPAPPQPPATTGRAVPRGSNFTRSGCLSPTDSAPLLALAAERYLQRGKNLSESEETLPVAPASNEDKDRIGDYVLLSKLDSHGLSYHALHAPSNKLKTCQVLSSGQLAHLLRVRQRLNSGGHSDVETAILPAGTEVVPAQGRYYLFSPRSYGSLHSYVQSRGKLSEDATRGLFRQIVGIVEHSHSLGIVVRDLKLRQFVFADQEQTILRMGSISDVVVLPSPEDDQLGDRHGCPAYVSPEILDLTQKTHSGKAADVWSLGVLLFVMLLGRYPFYDQTPSGLFGKIRDGSFWIPKEEGLSLEVRLVLRGLLRREPVERPTATLLSAITWLRTPQLTRPTNTLCDQVGWGTDEAAEETKNPASFDTRHATFHFPSPSTVRPQRSGVGEMLLPHADLHHRHPLTLPPDPVIT